MLEISNLHASYGAVRALERVSPKVGVGQIACLLGANGAGKTTTLNCVSGVVPAAEGRITFDGADITNRRVEDIVRRGVVQVPEGREIFPALSVHDNVLLGAWLYRRDGRVQSDLDRVYALFPRLAERAQQAAGTLSGGEQQMLMVGRALMARPKLLMFDEPSLGLSPVLVGQVFQMIRRIHASGVAILLVEQNARLALQASSYGYILENGEIVVEGESAALLGNEQVQDAYLGAKSMPNARERTREAHEA